MSKVGSLLQNAVVNATDIISSYSDVIVCRNVFLKLFYHYDVFIIQASIFTLAL